METQPRAFTGLKDLLTSMNPKPQAVFLDLWGVVHDGNKRFPGSLQALEALHAGGIDVVFVSNTPQRAASAMAKLDTLGIPKHLYKGMVTAGEAAFAHFEANKEPQTYYYIGPKEHDLLTALPNYTRTQNPAEANFVLAAAFTPEKPTLKDMQPELAACASAHLPMVCLNPDRITISQDGKVIRQGGKLGAQYQHLEGAGPVRYFGKPHKEVYDMALAIAGVPKNRILCIGDSPSHDIAGGNAQGLKTALIAKTGIMQYAVSDTTTTDHISALCRKHTKIRDIAARKPNATPKTTETKTTEPEPNPIPTYIIPAFEVGPERTISIGETQWGVS